MAHAARVQAGARDRLGWALLALGSAAVLVTSRLLTPDPHGVGTHLQLGLPPCGFLELFGKPCPACGLTTAFAHLAHGSLFESLHANPMGLPLFVLTVLLLGLALRGLVRGEALAQLVQGRAPLWIAVAVCGGLLVVWGVRLV